MLVLVLLTGGSLSTPPSPLSYVFSNNMVLQRAPRSARVWGIAAPGATINVRVNSTRTPIIDVTVQADATTGAWLASLPPQPATLGSVPTLTLTVAVNSGSTAATQVSTTLAGVRFGDVYHCGGQSNMALPLSRAFNATQEAAAAAQAMPLLRIVNNGIMWPPYGNTTGLQRGWLHANATTLESFSATCYFAGRDLYRSHAAAAGGNSSLAIGLISNNVGGTSIEQWSSATTLSQCAALWPDGTAKRAGMPGCHGSACVNMSLATCENKSTTQQWEQAGPWCAGLYEQMIEPLLPMSLAGFLFYQGENNYCAEEADGNFHNSTCQGTTAKGGRFYECAFAALIAGWRAAFDPPALLAQEQQGQQAPLPFVFAELDGFAGSNFAVLRAVQLAVAKRDPLHTAIAVNHDLGTVNDKGGKIHSPRKEELGRRLSLAMRRLQQRQEEESRTAPLLVTTGPALVRAVLRGNASSSSSSYLELTFEASAAGESEVYLHGTAGCIAPWNATPPCCPNGKGRPCCNPKPGSPSCLNSTCPAVVVGERCCDISPFALGWELPGGETISSGTSLVWKRHVANATKINGLVVTLDLNAAAAAPPAAGAILIGLRLNWEGYPNCGVYNAVGGPQAGAYSEEGAMAKGCVGYADCVYDGTALPAAPAQLVVLIQNE